MDGVTRPVGDLPSEVYWRRRLVTGAFVVLGLLVAYYLVRSLFAGGVEPVADPSTSTTLHPSANPTIAASAGPTAGATQNLADVRACGTSDVSIVLAPTTHDWAAATLPEFQGGVTQIGLSPCVLDTGAAGTELVVTSGPDRVWSNLDCATAPVLTAQQLLLAPGDTATLTATWARIRSDAACSTSLPSPLPGTYRATLTIQGISSDQAIFALTN